MLDSVKTGLRNVEGLSCTSTADCRESVDGEGRADEDGHRVPTRLVKRPSSTPHSDECCANSVLAKRRWSAVLTAIW